MRLSIYAVIETFILLAISVLWCEVGYYYFIFKVNCSDWPGPEDSDNGNQEKLTRMLILADTHIMGPVKSVYIDKLRREWQMKQAFSISNKIYRPDVIIILGDLLDEGSFSHDKEFHEAVEDFDRIFSYDKTHQERIIIAGNHDVGFHNQMILYPYLMKRFREKYFATSNIELVNSSKFRKLNIVASNSMSFYNDSCPFCAQSVAATNSLQFNFEQMKKDKSNSFSAPILLIHIPLYRQDDRTCEYPTSMSETVKKKNIQGEDVLHEDISNFLLERLKPRLILSGHTHMKCDTVHPVPSDQTKSIEELTISSYNHKYAEKRPGFLLMSVNSTHIFKKHCNLVEEWVIASVYLVSFITICIRLILLYRTNYVRKKSLRSL